MLCFTFFCTFTDKVSVTVGRRLGVVIYVVMNIHLLINGALNACLCWYSLSAQDCSIVHCELNWMSSELGLTVLKYLFNESPFCILINASRNGWVFNESVVKNTSTCSVKQSFCNYQYINTFTMLFPVNINDYHPPLQCHYIEIKLKCIFSSLCVRWNLSNKNKGT